MAKREKQQVDKLIFEREELAKGNKLIAGMDEVGRGPLAGPVCVACVIMPLDDIIDGIDDSKKVSEKKREKLAEEIKAKAISYCIKMIDEKVIDEINILEATKKAMREAASRVPAEVFLIDAVTGLGLNGKEISVIKGDASSYSIAAASIIAKVTRDRMLLALDREYPGYGFARNKGYGTAEHIAALKALGPCPQHRRSFIGHFVTP